MKKKIVKFLTKTFIGKITDKVVLGGAVSSTVEQTPRTNGGELDVKEIVLTIITSTLPIIMLIAIIKGWLSIEQVKELVHILMP